MGAYSYKEVMYRDDFQKAIKPCMESCGATESDYDGDANYDGDAWIVTAFLLEQKDAEIATLTARVRELEAENMRLREVLETIADYNCVNAIHGVKCDGYCPPCIAAAALGDG